MKKKTIVLMVAAFLVGVFGGGLILTRAMPGINLSGSTPKVVQQVEDVVTIVIDVSGWTQTEKNYLMAAAVSLLYQYDNRFDGSGISIPQEGVIAILKSKNPPATLADIWSATALKNWIVAELEASRIATEIAKIEAAVRETEIATSPYKDIKLADIDTLIDSQVNAINTLAEAKTFLKAFLKKFVRYVVAKS